MNLVVIGHKGQLGWELCREARERGWPFQGFDLPEIDITDPENIRHHLSGIDSGVVVNAAAYTAVDKAESEKDAAFAVNALGAGLVAAACNENGLPLVHISTDYVFSGEKATDYLETDPVSPLGVYGESKAAGEDAVRKAWDRHVIVRTAWLYGVNGHNFVKTMLRLGKENETLRVVADQVGSPTDARDLAGAILTACQKMKATDSPHWGTYHYCGAGSTSWHGFAEAIFRFSRDRFPLKVRRVEAIPTTAYPTPARRPARSVLDCSRFEAAFGIVRRPWADSLRDMLNRLPLPDESV